MREIKFRLLVKNWDDSLERYYYWTGTKFNDIITDSWKEIVVEDLQYTWLNDKNGNNIYEGDVLQVDVEHINTHNWYKWRESSVIQVEFIWLSYNIDFQHSNVFTMEVIWNIYENPDLLEDLNY